LATIVPSELEPFRYRIELAFVFGSMIRGDVRPDSDVDIMIISEIYVFELGKPIKTMRKLLGVGFHAELSRFFHREVSHL
jgi:predicted nucleotidyltransferase